MDHLKQFSIEKKKNIKKQGVNKKLKNIAIDFLINSSKYKYTYNFNWLGIPIIQFPQDIVAIQEIIWEIKPDLIIETGIAHGGSLMLSASMLQLLNNNGEVVGIDIEIREHNRKKIEKNIISKRITMIEGSSIDPEVIKKVSEIVKKHKTIMVFLDSFHTHKHVLAELNLYSSFVSKKSYLVAFDSSIEHMPEGFFKDRPWDKGNNPASAIKVFLEKNKNFIIDEEIDNKLIISSTLGGYLKRIK